MIEYFDAPDVKKRLDEIVQLLLFDHVCTDSLYCIRSKGSRARRTIARIHGLNRIWQKVMEIEPAYIIEVISERFDRLDEAEQDKTLIHELLHIPKGFKGGFRPHKRYVNKGVIETWYIRLQNKRRESRKDKL